MTRLGHKLTWRSNVIQDQWEGESNREDFIASILDLQDQSVGLDKSFLLIPHYLVNKALLVQFAYTPVEYVTSDGETRIRITLEEQVKGVPPLST